MKEEIVIVDSSLAVTGGFTGAMRMARLLEPWANVTVVLPAAADVPADQIEGFAEVVRLPLVQIRKSLTAVAAYLPALLLAGLQLRALLRRKNASVLVINDFFLLHGWIARRFGYRGRIVTWVRFDPHRFPVALSKLWLGAARRSSDAIVTVSEFMRTRLPPNLRARLVYESIAPDLPVGRVPGNARNDVVFLGNYIRGKGQEDAIAAFRKVANRFPNLRLVFHGGDMGLARNRAYRQELERQVARCGLANRVVFGGLAFDLERIFATAAAAVNLSQSESFSFTCLEAAQCGVPVIAYRSGGPAEIIEDGVTGRLCDIGTIPCVANALASLLGDPQRAAAMGEAAARHVAAKFGTEAYVRGMKSVLQI